MADNVLGYSIGKLDPSTWDAFADLVQRNNGIYGGCRCAPNHVEWKQGRDHTRTLKEELVRAGRVHQALVFDSAGDVQGWCQYGRPGELRLKHRRAYERDPPPRADWRIACIFVDKRHRGQGIARAAVEGALQQIGAEGGGLVEAVSEATSGREAQGRFLFTATVELLEDLGFGRVRQLGKHAWLVSRAVDAV